MSARNPLRGLCLMGGVTCIGLGAIGVFVPGLPTTVFVLSGSYLLARSSPALDERLRASTKFAPYLKYLDPAVPMPRRAKVAAIVSMWTSIGLSTVALRLSGTGGLGMVALLVAGVAGTWSIVVFRRGLPDQMSRT